MQQSLEGVNVRHDQDVPRVAVSVRSTSRKKDPARLRGVYLFAGRCPSGKFHATIGLRLTRLGVGF